MNSKIKRVFTIVFVTQLIDLLAFTLILPLLPKLLDFYAENDKSGLYNLVERTFANLFSKLINTSTSHNQVLLAGLLGSWFSLLQFISSPFVGALSDKFGRKPIMLIASTGSLVSYIIWFFADQNFALFVLSRTIGGLSKSTVGLSLAIISDVADDSSRGKGMALIGSSFSLAFILGPSIGAYLSTLAKGNHLSDNLIRNPSLIATLLTLLNQALICFFLEESNTISKKTKQLIRTEDLGDRKIKSSFNSSISKALHYINPMSLFLFKLVKHNSVREAAILQSTGLIYFSYLLFYSGLEFTLSFLTHLRFGFSSTDQSKLYLFSGILMIIIQGGFVRRLKPGKEPSIAFIGLLVIIPAFITIGLSNNVSQIYYSLILYSISSAVVVPCLTTMVSSHCPSNYKGAVMGTLRSLGALARAIGPCLASFIFWTLGSTACYMFGAMALSWPLYKMTYLYSNLKKIDKDSIICRERVAKAN